MWTFFRAKAAAKADEKKVYKTSPTSIMNSECRETDPRTEENEFQARAKHAVHESLINAGAR